jgi:hypothetical protein
MMNGREYSVAARDGSEVYGTTQAGDPTMTDGFMVASPATHARFHASLLTILQSFHTALYWPGARSLVIGQSDTRQHLPPDMIAALGEPHLATDPWQILERIQQS